MNESVKSCMAFVDQFKIKFDLFRLRDVCDKAVDNYYETEMRDCITAGVNKNQFWNGDPILKYCDSAAYHSINWLETFTKTMNNSNRDIGYISDHLWELNK